MSELDDLCLLSINVIGEKIRLLSLIQLNQKSELGRSNLGEVDCIYIIYFYNSIMRKHNEKRRIGKSNAHWLHRWKVRQRKTKILRKPEQMTGRKREVSEKELLKTSKDRIMWRTMIANVLKGYGT